MIRTLILAACAAALGTSAAAAQPVPVPQAERSAPAPADRPITAAQVAAAATPRLPQSFGNDGTLTRAVAEGSMLVLTYEVSGAVAAAVPAEELARRHAAPFCASTLGEPFFRSGNSLRIDIAVAGNGAPPRSTAVISNCAAH
jgi:hypothetical protein